MRNSVVDGEVGRFLSQGRKYQAVSIIPSMKEAEEKTQCVSHHSP